MSRRTPAGPTGAQLAPAGAACRTCPARHGRCVPPEPSQRVGGPALAIVGEGPGMNELEAGRPFVGRSGQMLERGLSTLGLTRADVHWTNAILCDCGYDDLAEARKACSARLRTELQTVAAPVVVPVGGLGLASTFGRKGRVSILEWRGSVTHDPTLGPAGAYVLPTVHPAFVMRASAWGAVLEEDFARVGRVLANGFTPPELQANRRIIIASTVEELAALLPQLGRRVAGDVETVGLGPTVTRLVCMAFSDRHTSIVVPWTRGLDGRESWWGGRATEVQALLSEMLATRTLVTHNGPSFDHIIFLRYKIRFRRWDDTLLMSHVVHGWLPKKLSFVAQRYLDVAAWKQFENAANIEARHAYNGRDSLYTALVDKPLRTALRESGREELYRIDKKCAVLCRGMQMAGFQFDSERAAVLAARLESQEAEIVDRCASSMQLAKLNLLSSKQLQECFFGSSSRALGAYVAYRSEKTGKPCLNVEVMRAYAASGNERLATFANDVLAYRRLRKVRKTNLVNPAKLVDRRGRIHSTWMNYSAVSGRFGSQGPNLMNLPTRANDPTIVHCGTCNASKCKCDCDRCAGVRGVYTARDGYVLIAPDAKQLEMRVAAYWSGDPAMIAACEATDMHAANAVRIFAEAFTDGDDATQYKLRQLAKSAGFAVCYMAEALTVYERVIAMGVRVTLRQVEVMLRRMRREFAVYYERQLEALIEIARTGYVREDMTGRVRWLGNEPSPTEAANFPIQGGAAGLMNTKLPAIVAALRARNLPTTLIAQVHDSATFETREDVVDEVSAVITEIFSAPVEFCGREVVFPLDFKTCYRWA